MDSLKEKKTYIFNSPDREYWIRRSIEIRNEVVKSKYDLKEVITIVIESGICHLEPFHIVLLSCIIDDLKSKKYMVRLTVNNKDLEKLIYEDISIKEYWTSEKCDHVESHSREILNLWRVTDFGKEGYSISVEKYFKDLFPEKDMSMVRTLLNELYFNIFDHAHAEGNAFSYVRYKADEGKIHIAICDYGIGISASLGGKFEGCKDSYVLKKSLESGVTSGSKAYNKGFGLDTVVTFLKGENMFRMVSNKGLIKLTGKNGSCEMFDIDFDFNGTLIYFDISIDSFEQDFEFGSFTL